MPNRASIPHKAINQVKASARRPSSTSVPSTYATASVARAAPASSGGAVSASGEVRSQLLRVPEQSGEANRFPSLLAGSSSRLSLRIITGTTTRGGG